MEPLRMASLDEVEMDPVTRFLHASGLPTETACLGQSAFELGRCVRVATLELIYRFERGVLFICDMTAIDAPAHPVGAMRVLVSLIHAVERSVPEVSAVEGLVPIEGNDEDGRDAEDGKDGEGGKGAEAALGRRLLEVYRKLGAQCDPEQVPGMVHVRYTMRGGAQQARLAPA
jgi:hypothetical protein